jgi:hypothetical protein
MFFYQSFRFQKLPPTFEAKPSWGIGTAKLSTDTNVVNNTPQHS